jgi:hypothetical protein
MKLLTNIKKILIIKWVKKQKTDEESNGLLNDCKYKQIIYIQMQQTHTNMVSLQVIPVLCISVLITKNLENN